MAREKPTLLCEIVPFTKWRVEALCRVARRPVFSVHPGDILARDGAWDHKYVVMSVDHVSDCEYRTWNDCSSYIEPGVLYKVTVRNLGRFYSDNRFTPASRTNDVSIDIRIGLQSGEQQTSALKLVQPIGHVLAPTVNLDRTWATELMNRYESSWSYHWTFKHGAIHEVTLKNGQNGPMPPKLKAGEKSAYSPQIAVVSAGSGIPEQPPLSPEAILAHFAL